MRIIIFILISAVLSSCTTDAERAAAREKRVQEDMSYADQMCVSYGFKREDQYFALCMQTVINNLKQERAAEAQPCPRWGNRPCAWRAPVSAQTDVDNVSAFEMRRNLVMIITAQCKWGCRQRFGPHSTPNYRL